MAFFLGIRYARARRGGGFIAFINTFSTVGILIGVAALILVNSVMNGFEHQLKQRILTLVPQLIVHPQAPLDKASQWQPLLQPLVAQPGVAAATPYLAAEAMIQSPYTLRGVYMEGLWPSLTPLDDLAAHIVAGDLSRLKSGAYQIVLSRFLSNQLGVDIGDKVRLLVPEGARFTPLGRVPSQRTFTIVALYELGSQADNQFIYVHGDDAARMLRRKPGAAEGIRLYLDDAFAASQIAHQLAEQHTDWTFDDWHESYGELFHAVKTEKGMMWLLLSLIIAVAAFNMVSALVMLVLEMRSDIAILSTLGLTPGSISLMFVVQGAWHGVVGTLVGAVVGILMSQYINPLLDLFHIQIVPPGIYDAGQLPVFMEPGQVATIIVSSLLLSLLATCYPAFRAARTQPAEALRYE